MNQQRPQPISDEEMAKISRDVAKLPNDGILFKGLMSWLFPTSENDWRNYALCAETGDNFSQDLCAACPVRVECLDDRMYYEDSYKVDRDDEDLPRGGLTSREQLSLAKHRSRYNPYFIWDIRIPLHNAMTVLREVRSTCAES